MISKENEDYFCWFKKNNGLLNLLILLICIFLPITLYIIKLSYNFSVIKDFYLMFLIPSILIIIISSTLFILNLKKAAKKNSNHTIKIKEIVISANQNNSKIVSSTKFDKNKLKIKPITIILTIIINFAAFSLLFSVTDFTIEKWKLHPELRPYMVSSFLTIQSKYNLGYDDITKNQEPDFLGFYSYDEINSFFESEIKNDDIKDVKISYNDKISEEIYFADVFYAFSDSNNKNYWLVVMYAHNYDGTPKFISVTIVPSGTVLTIGAPGYGL